MLSMGMLGISRWTVGRIIRGVVGGGGIGGRMSTRGRGVDFVKGGEGGIHVVGHGLALIILMYSVHGLADFMKGAIPIC